MQLNLLEEKRDKAEIYPDCWLIPNFLNLAEQEGLLAAVRDWCKGLFHTPKMPNGTPLNHPIACLGWDWVPYEYRPAKAPMPEKLQQLTHRALQEVPGCDRYLKFWKKHSPDTAIVNWFPPGTKLGTHVDRSEDETLRDAGSPIVTIALGAKADLYIGGFYREDKSIKVEMMSGDVLIMHGTSRNRFHEVRKIYKETSQLETTMKAPGRISVTIRRAKV